MEVKEKWFILRTVVSDVILPLVKHLLHIWSVVQLYITGRPWWALVTLLAILTPGTLEVIYWLASCCFHVENKTNLKAWQWILFFNPLLFEFSSIIWIAYTLTDLDMYHDLFSTFTVLDRLQSFTQDASMSVLQFVIIVATWNDAREAENGYTTVLKGFAIDVDGVLVTHIVQLSSAVFAIFGLAKIYSTHHFFEISGKEVIPSFWDSFKAHLFYVAFMICRLPSLILLALIYRHFFFILLLTLILVNFILSFSFLGRNMSKSVWTGVSSILAPTCFVAKSDIATLPNAGKTFFKFYIFNSIAFIIITFGAHLGVDIYLGTVQTLTPFFLESLERIPFLNWNCSPKHFDCAYIYSAISVVLSGLEFILLLVMYISFPSLWHTGVSGLIRRIR